MSKNIIDKLPGLTIAIPAYNEEESLPWVLDNTLRTAPRYLSDFEILVVDDGSVDRTAEIARQFAKKDNRVRLVQQVNGGYGEAMLRGIREAKKDFVAYMPADGQFLVHDMRFSLPHMRHADLILGNRGRRTDYSLYRHILSSVYLVVLRVLFGIRYKDVNWLTIWRTKEVKKMHIESRGIFLLAEIVIRFKRKGLKITEAVSFYHPRRAGQVKNTKISIVMRTFFDAVRFWAFFKN